MTHEKCKYDIDSLKHGRVYSLGSQLVQRPHHLGHVYWRRINKECAGASICIDATISLFLKLIADTFSCLFYFLMKNKSTIIFCESEFYKGSKRLPQMGILHFKGCVYLLTGFS